MIIQSYGLRRPDDGPLFCTRGKHFTERSEFKLRRSGRPHSWCMACKREYDKEVYHMKAGDTITVDGVKAKVLASSDVATLDFEELDSGKRRWIGVAPGVGNPRVKVIERIGEGPELPTAEWPEHAFKYSIKRSP